jgi:hypothetical protein
MWSYPKCAYRNKACTLRIEGGKYRLHGSAQLPAAHPYFAPPVLCAWRDLLLAQVCGSRRKPRFYAVQLSNLGSDDTSARLSRLGTFECCCCCPPDMKESPTSQLVAACFTLFTSSRPLAVKMYCCCWPADIPQQTRDKQSSNLCCLSWKVLVLPSPLSKQPKLL